MNKESKSNGVIMEKFEPLLKDMENRVYDMAKWHDNNFLTLCWFLIATCWIIITSDNVSDCVKKLLVWSIILIVLWLLLSNNLNAAQTLKFKKSTKALLKISEDNTIEENNLAWWEACKYMEINKKDIFFSILATILENLWIILFIIWLIKFL